MYFEGVFMNSMDKLLSKEQQDIKEDRIAAPSSAHETIYPDFDADLEEEFDAVRSIN